MAKQEKKKDELPLDSPGTLPGNPATDEDAPKLDLNNDEPEVIEEVDEDLTRKRVSAANRKKAQEALDRFDKGEGIPDLSFYELYNQVTGEEEVYEGYLIGKHNRLRRKLKEFLNPENK